MVWVRRKLEKEGEEGSSHLRRFIRHPRFEKEEKIPVVQDEDLHTIRNPRVRISFSKFPRSLLFS